MIMIYEKKKCNVNIYKMSRLFDKLKSGGTRLFDKMKGGSSRLFGKFQTQVLNNPRVISTVSRGLGDVGHYGSRVGPIIGSLGGLTAQPELVALGGAVSAGSAAATGGAHLLKDRTNYLERAQSKKNDPIIQHFV